MPQYLAPGVYVEEIPGPRTIAAVSTSTAGFVGPTRSGPTSGRPELLTSYQDFVSVYGDAVDLQLDDVPVTNHLALSVRGFFDEGGSSLYVSRVFAFTGDDPKADHASLGLPNSSKLTAVARFPGLAGRMQVTFTLVAGRNVLVGTGATARLSRVRPHQAVWVPNDATAGVAGRALVVVHDPATDTMQLGGQAAAVPLSGLTGGVYPISVVVDIARPTRNAQGQDAYGPRTTVGEFGFHPAAVGTGITTVLAPNPPTRALALRVPLALEPDATGLPTDPDRLAVAFVGELFTTAALRTITNPDADPSARQYTITLTGGGDGGVPDATVYDGSAAFEDYQSTTTINPNTIDAVFHGLPALEAVEDISIVAAPGATSGWGQDAAAGAADAQAISRAVVTHCERMLYRTAALDTPPGLLPTGALDWRNLGSSTHAALYYPWLTVSHPVDGSRVSVPPAAYMAGVWARSDNFRGVIKAPANEPVRSALDLELRLNKAQQELLNPQGVNCVRFFPGPGHTVWGARTISEDPEWKYLNIRRYFNYVEKSIDEGTQWVVFEINGPALWASVKSTIEGFLLSEWRTGALLGSKPEQGFFVRCDATTMTAQDLDQGRLICQIGIAAARPAEFVIFRIAQMTATPTA